MNRLHRAVCYLGTSVFLFLVSLAMIDYWIFRWFEGSTALYNYWIAVGLTFVSFGLCLATVLWMANPNAQPSMLLAVFFTPFMLLVAGIWDWILYFIYMRYGSPYPDWSVWSAQYRWLGFWSFELQVLWTIIFLALLTLVWYKILKR